MRISCGYVVSFLCVTAMQAAAAQETPAVAERQQAPDYPASCRPIDDENVPVQNVFVMFDIDDKGQTQNVRVRESTDRCFNEASVAAVRSWTYEPRRINRRPAKQVDMEVAFTFQWKQASRFEDYDASPISRVPPVYPQKCMRRAKNEENVLVRFDVAIDGTTTNMAVVDSTNNCLNEAALTAVSKWRYRPSTIGGKRVARLNVETLISFRLESSTQVSPEFVIRPTVARRLTRIKKKLGAKKDPEEILADLDELEKLYGDDFSRAELSSFYQLRAAARIEIGDYQGALDDLRVVRSAGANNPEAAESVAKLIFNLEAALAQAEAQNQTANDEKR